MRRLEFCFWIWAISSVGQSCRLITGWSGVRVPDGPPSFIFSYRGIAQLVEQRSPKPRAEGSSPSAPAIDQGALKRLQFGVCGLFLCPNRPNGHSLKIPASRGKILQTPQYSWIFQLLPSGTSSKKHQSILGKDGFVPCAEDGWPAHSDREYRKNNVVMLTVIISYDIIWLINIKDWIILDLLSNNLLLTIFLRMWSIMYEVFITCKRTDMDGGLSKDFKIAEHLYHLSN